MQRLLPFAAAGLGIAVTAAIAIGSNPETEEIPQLGEICVVNQKMLHILHHSLNDNYVVFIHGFGGQMAQFQSQIEYFTGKCSVFAIDFVGHGKSFGGKFVEDYRIDSIVEDIYTALSDFGLLDKKLLFVCHSLGTLIGAKLSQKVKAAGVVLMAPKAEFTEEQVKGMHKLGKLSPSIFDAMRFADRLGGAHSHSVNRILCKHATEAVRQKQLVFNKATPSEVVQSMLNASYATRIEDFKISKTPVIIMAGEFDRVTPLDDNVPLIAEVNDISSENILFYPCGHNIMLEETDRVNQDLWEFSKSVFSN